MHYSSGKGCGSKALFLSMVLFLRGVGGFCTIFELPDQNCIIFVKIRLVNFSNLIRLNYSKLRDLIKIIFHV